MEKIKLNNIEKRLLNTKELSLINGGVTVCLDVDAHALT